MADKIVKGIAAVWVAAIVLGFVFIGTVIWAIITMVNHYN